MEPQTCLGLAPLTRMAFEGRDLTPLKLQLLMQSMSGPARAAALMDLSVVDQLLGAAAHARNWQAEARRQCQVFATAREGRGRLTALIYSAAGDMGANTPVDFLLRNSDFNVLHLYLDPAVPPPAVLPHHDVAFCAAPMDGDPAFLAHVAAAARVADVPVVNLPAHAPPVARDTLATCAPATPGLRFARTTRITRRALELALMYEAERDIIRVSADYPFVIRPVGSHAGLGLARVDTRAELAAYLHHAPQDAFFVQEFVDFATPRDGLYRKMRIVFVDGQPFPVHLAFGQRWDLWYMNAGMAEDAAKRRAEADFMDSFDTDFAPRHAGAFAALVGGLGLDYFGIDCAEDAAGNLVVFEADNALIVHDMDCTGDFAYKHPHMQRVFAAFQSMLAARCETPPALPLRPLALPDRAALV